MTLIGTQITMLKSEPNGSQEWIPFVTQQVFISNILFLNSTLLSVICIFIFSKDLEI